MCVCVCVSVCVNVCVSMCGPSSQQHSHRQQQFSDTNNFKHTTQHQLLLLACDIIVLRFLLIIFLIIGMAFVWKGLFGSEPNRKKTQDKLGSFSNFAGVVQNISENLQIRV